MKMNLKFLSASALFAAAAFSASAQTVSLNDIVVGFRNSGAAQTNNLEIKAGSVSLLSSFTTETLIGNYNTALNTQVSTWATGTSGAASENWSAAGSASASLVFATKRWDVGITGTLGVQNSTGWAIADTGTPNTNINTMYTSFNSGAAVPNGDGSSITIAKANAGSWQSQANGAAAFGAFNPNNNGFAQTAAASAAGPQPFSAEDLYSVTTSGSTFLGTFALYNADGLGHLKGDLTFTAAAAAIPEPSTYAAILGAAVLGLVMLRRRNQAALV